MGARVATKANDTPFPLASFASMVHETGEAMAEYLRCLAKDAWDVSTRGEDVRAKVVT